uniref:Cytochrome P450 1A5-like n=1 Tax=Saccoglossus kowalevskii TaxID=10224 RepID=A0ABM0LTM9_SACKO|nr:PREDICTED: cytochrome P450 1A5-like [Saccoglossus kowalevskii]
MSSIYMIVSKPFLSCIFGFIILGCQDLVNDPHLTLVNYGKKYGDVFTMKIGSQPVIVLNSIDVIKEALVKKQNDFAGRPYFYSLSSLMSEKSQNIVFGDFTAKWKLQRKIGHQAIRNYASGEKLESLIRCEAFPTFQRAVSQNNGKPFLPKPLLFLLVGNIIASMCFGKSTTVISMVLSHFLAGLDTTINTLNWFVAYLTYYPDVQSKVQREIDDVIGDGRLPLLSDKGKLPYCEAVIYEVMRIRTVVPLAIPHTTTVDTSVGLQDEDLCLFATSISQSTVPTPDGARIDVLSLTNNQCLSMFIFEKDELFRLKSALKIPHKRLWQLEWKLYASY